ncbi:hypothetical protein RGQ29_025459 [Quercus rubra]|uniref:PPM-type phosphatase domain-containing protein n=1 Tax=Quercus rubra TaxID=3512 RepID=A0AAN7EYB0_QUERU|nr:hypothetical protein RGQ29_025459 [Quercus rubra]
MGACCTKDVIYGRAKEDDCDENEDQFDKGETQYGDGGARIRLEGHSSFISMYTQQGKKGTNQDAMTVWEDFTGDKERLFCGVFDGHGPLGHRVARTVRDNLPSKLTAAVEDSQHNRCKDVGADDEEDHGHNDHSDSSLDSKDSIDNENSQNLSFSSWESSFVKAFNETDEELGLDSSIDSYCSGTTAVTIVKQDEHLIIANLGDSRAVLGTRGDNDKLVPIQLTADHKPCVPSEAERIMSCEGRIFAADEEPDVYRVWMPECDCPGLAMSRAFGDFCIKDCGLISTPEVCYRKITSNDEFLVLATDGVWDALSNNEVVRIVASAKRRSMAAKLLVAHAINGWKYKYPTSKVDDCAVICLFFKSQTTKPMSKNSNSNVNNPKFLDYRSIKCRGESPGSVIVNDNRITVIDRIGSKKECDALDGKVSRVNTILKISRSLSFMSRRKSSKRFDEFEAH